MEIHLENSGGRGPGKSRPVIGAAPAPEPRKLGLGRPWGSARWTLRSACQELADGPVAPGGQKRGPGTEIAAMERREASGLAKTAPGPPTRSLCATWRSIPSFGER